MVFTPGQTPPDIGNVVERNFKPLVMRLTNLRVPTIARVQGAALGGGTGLTAACDIAVASTKAVFATSEVKFGIIPAAISPYVVRAIGARQSYRFFQTAERIDAQRACALGLVHEVVAPEQLDAKVQEMVQALLQGRHAAEHRLHAAAQRRQLHHRHAHAAAQRARAQKRRQRRAVHL